MKKLPIALICNLLMLPVIANTLESERESQQREYLKSKGLPLPDEGILLVDKSELNIPKYILDKRQAEQKQFIKLGYIKEDSPRATELLNFRKNSKEQFHNYQSIHNPYGTFLRTSPIDLHMGYTYKGIPQNIVNNYIGIAPIGTYKIETGWSGAVAFFENTAIGTCAYTERNLTITHGSSHIDKDIVKHDVNGKVTLIDIRGTEATGFLYNIVWIDNEFDRTFECASKTFSPDIANKVIDMAKQIDLNQ